WFIGWRDGRPVTRRDVAILTHWARNYVPGTFGPDQVGAYSADGSRFAYGGDMAPGVTIESTGDDVPPVLAGTSEHAWRVALSGDGSIVAAAFNDNRLAAFRTSDGTELARFRVPHW